jgi:succinate dehydrogenase/fumarate reductase cytochrome b subunit
MTSTERQLLGGCVILAGILAGHILAVLLKPYMSAPKAMGLAFYLVASLLVLGFRKQLRFGLLLSLVLCVFAGVIAFLMELWRPGW